MRSFPLYIVVVLLAFSSCGKEETLTFEKPDSYTFERNGLTSVDFNGQTTRIRMAEELSSALLNPQIPVRVCFRCMIIPGTMLLMILP